MHPRTTDDPAIATDLVALRERIDAVLETFLAAKAREADKAQLPSDYVDALHSFVFTGGKRTRPLLCALGWFAAGGSERIPNAIVRAAASLEMYHAAVLIHNDIIGDTVLRHGHLPLHRAMSARYADRSDADGFGRHAAALLGNLALIWSDELLSTAHLTARQRAAAVSIVSTMRADVIYGQFLDLLATARSELALDEALRIIRYKVVAYTCERPLELGASLAGAPGETREALAVYARLLGEAFQLNRDLQGVLDDLRRGRRTVVIGLALQRADTPRQRELCRLLGDPTLDEDDAQRCRDILTATGAHAEVERMVAQRRDQALSALDRAPMPTPAVAALRLLAIRLTHARADSSAAV
ncbi:polyprenyl synthetase family protein [Nocardia pseudobrasiliensis]|uniref:Geranylgeranyl diphosphate synthase type I n=1 Tax=Nocardia pseudobrasiliensis TaxID=45979 RepID=A0A370I887_9NOCA|nr:polyprenyl synthetase family protein [Nocardia pseudobrasiliensis]RDI66908.1 geranylgeranyl diphosphate synthase type I [Nocardia pseudobrasiliensis]